LRGIMTNGVLEPDYNRDVQTKLTPAFRRQYRHRGGEYRRLWLHYSTSAWLTCPHGLWYLGPPALRCEDSAVDIAVKIVIAPIIFGAFLYFVSGIRMHRAAGMMLTFPALNGITLAFSPNALSLASGMLPMIAVNGVL
jgi:hypothetical protein